MDKELLPQKNDVLLTPDEVNQQMTLFEDKIDLVLQKSYLQFLSESPICPLKGTYAPINWIKITKIVYEKGVFFADKMAMLYSALHHCAGSVVMVVQKIKKGPVEIFLGTRDENGFDNVSAKILEAGLKGILPGLQTDEELAPEELLETSIENDGTIINKLFSDDAGISSVSCIGSLVDEKKESFVQGIENLINSCASIPTFSAWFIAEKVPHTDVTGILSAYEGLYSSIAPFAKIQYSMNESDTQGVSHSVTEGFNESVSKSVTHTVTTGTSVTKTTGHSTSITASKSWGGNLSIIVAGVNSNTSLSTSRTKQESEAIGENTQVGDATGDVHAHGKHKDSTKGENRSQTTGKTILLSSENRHARSCMEKIDRQIKRIEKGSSSGLWSVATYFISTGVSTSKKMASIYRGTIVGKDSDIETVAINHWSGKENLTLLFQYLSKGLHPVFALGQKDLLPTAGAFVDSSELSVHLSLPQSSVSGVLVREENSFGRNVIRDEIPDDKHGIKIGNIVHLGDEFKNEHVVLDKTELSKHTFVCGTTGSGKSNTLYLILDQLLNQDTKVLVIEPAKGEYKTVFGKTRGMRVFGTSPKEGKILTINPFVFPDAVDIYEHIDALVETFCACWPMYAAMPQVLKHSIIEAYKECGWNLETSSCPLGLFPSVEDVIDALKTYINSSDYSNETKGDYKGSLETRLNSLCEGQIGRIFKGIPIDDEVLFNENVIVDLSRIRSTETKSLLMGMLILKLNEFRTSEKKGMNRPLHHVTVLEEAHNLLKRTSTVQSAESSNVAGMAVERIANGMAEMRTYGEGFIIADQSPSMLDLSTVRNTNTKIVMALPEKEDQLVAGRSIGLTEEQITEIPRLKKGEAIVYQNAWEEPVKVKISLYEPSDKERKDEEKDVEEAQTSNLFVDIFSTLYDIYTGRQDKETIDYLINSIKASSIRGSSKYKILTHLQAIDSISTSDCATIFALIIGPSIYSQVKSLDDMLEVECVINRSLGSIPALSGNSHLMSFINMYFMGCSNSDHSDFYESWITRNSFKSIK